VDVYERLKTGEKGAWISIAAYLALAALKLYVGYISDSEALMADGINNTTDILVSAAVLIGLKLSRKPPDVEHRYGHFRAETIAQLVASLIIAAVGVQVLVQAVKKFLAPEQVPPDPLAAWTALFSGIAMFLVYVYNRRLARRTKSSALMAAAQDNRSDALVSLGAFVGILGSQAGFAWLDTLTAGIVGVVIIVTGFNIFREASHSLADGFPEKELKMFRKTIQDTPGVKNVKEIRARAHGNYVLVDVTILVSREMSVGESHDITEEIERRMKEQHDVEHVHIHIEPAD
jgi:cation diffusion facilitator family transporter